MSRMKTFGSVSVLGLFALTAACASEEVTVSQPSEPSGSAAASEPAAPEAGSSTSIAPGATSSTAAGGANCLTSELSVTLGAPSGAAGSTELTVQFANIGSRTCILDGYPGVSYVSSPGGAQVGQAAVRTGSPVSPVDLAPGASASAAVKASVVGNYPEAQCEPTSVSGLDVYSPNTTEVVYLPYPTTGCNTSDASITQLAVQPVVAG